MNNIDHQVMQRALRLAERGLYSTDPNPRVGCVVVKNGIVIGEGWHQQAGDSHAEINALRQIDGSARGATVYVTLEPCCHHGRTPPCSKALIEAGVKRVVIAMQDPNPMVEGQGMTELRAAGILVEYGVLQQQAEKLNQGFISRMSRGRPWVCCKLAMSMDGRTAMSDGESKWITSGQARDDVQRLRARSSAIVTGIGTVVADDPALNVRLPELGKNPRQPLWVVLDRKLRISPEARLLSLPGSVLVFTADPELHRADTINRCGAEVVKISLHDGGLNLEEAMQILAQREINEVLLEAGATLSGAMLQAGLIDELVIYLAPHLMGDLARGLFHLPGIETMQQRIGLDIQDIRAVGQDWRISATVVKQNCSSSDLI